MGFRARKDLQEVANQKTIFLFNQDTKAQKEWQPPIPHVIHVYYFCFELHLFIIYKMWYDSDKTYYLLQDTR